MFGVFKYALCMAVLLAGSSIGVSAQAGFSHADFFGLMPSDNSTVSPGMALKFPQDGSIVGTGVSRTGPSTFNLASIGTYHVTFDVSIVGVGQLILVVNGADLPYTVVGSNEQLVGISLVVTTVANSILEVKNPQGNSAVLTTGATTGGVKASTAHLRIRQLFAGVSPSGVGCVSVPCQHGGVCTQSGTSYTCNCDNTGYTGANCEAGGTSSASTVNPFTAVLALVSTVAIVLA